MDVKIHEIKRKIPFPFSLKKKNYIVYQMNSSTIINLFHRSRPKKSTFTINLDYSDSIACQPTTIIYIYQNATNILLSLLRLLLLPSIFFDSSIGYTATWYRRSDYYKNYNVREKVRETYTFNIVLRVLPSCGNNRVLCATGSGLAHKKLQLIESNT